MNPKKILFVYSQWQSFVKEDFHLLSDDFNVQKLHFELNKKPYSFIKGQVFGIFSLLWQIPRRDLVFIWFCDYHAFWSVLISKVFRKKSVIVVGGFDAVKIPRIDYGLFMRTGIRVKLAQWAYQNCDRIIAVDSSLFHGKNSYAGENAVVGISHFVKNIESKSLVIPTGYDDLKWKIKDKKLQVLTVALIKDQKVFDRKGIQLFLGVAKALPEIPFYLVGLQNQDLIPDEFKNLPNLKIYPILPQEDLIVLYSESKVYVQFSISEGLPNVLCEAMMSGCIPVGSSVNGIPLAVGDCGFILKEENLEQAILLVKNALDENEEKSKCARKRIQKLFPKYLRKEKLKQMIIDLFP